MPASTSPAVLLCTVSLALLPGATGRADVHADRRTSLLATLRDAVRAARSVTVVAPGLRTWTTACPVTDPGASGLDSPARAGDVPTLHVTGSAAVELVRLAGWTGAVTAYELGPDDERPLAAVAQHLLDGARHDDLLLLACASAEGTLPDGASAALVAGEARAHAVHGALLAHLDARAPAVTD